MSPDQHKDLWVTVATAAPVIALAFAVVVQSSFDRLAAIMGAPELLKWLRAIGVLLALGVAGISLYYAANCGLVLLDAFKSLRLHRDVVPPHPDEFVLYRALGWVFVALIVNGLLTIVVALPTRRLNRTSSLLRWANASEVQSRRR